MKKLLFTATLLIAGLLSSQAVFAQCDIIATDCERHFTSEYLSDGQDYRALLVDDQTAEFNLNFYGGSTYRLGACSGKNDGNLIFRLYDEERNLLFSNEDHQLAPYWDFKVNSTMSIIIEANLNLDRIESGCAVLLVGFKP